LKKKSFNFFSFLINNELVRVKIPCLSRSLFVFLLLFYIHSLYHSDRKSMKIVSEKRILLFNSQKSEICVEEKFYRKQNKKVYFEEECDILSSCDDLNSTEIHKIFLSFNVIVKIFQIDIIVVSVVRSKNLSNSHSIYYFLVFVYQTEWKK
jgi:hypothetical protein